MLFKEVTAILIKYINTLYQRYWKILTFQQVTYVVRLCIKGFNSLRKKSFLKLSNKHIS